MPFLYLSPSTQEFNPYITSENEEYWMNRLADAMEPYLRASGVNFTRNDPSTNAATAIRESNAGAYDFHLALHSNASGAPAAGSAPLGAYVAGNNRGIDVYYYPTSTQGLAMADLLVANLQTVYPLPDRVRALATTSIGEVRRTNAPAVLAELGYHDNEADALWIENSLDAIAAAIVRAVTEYFGLPFLPPSPVRAATVKTSGSPLNLRAYPDTDAAIYLTIPNGAQVELYGETDGWYTVGYDGTIGFAAKPYLIT